MQARTNLSGRWIGCASRFWHEAKPCHSERAKRVEGSRLAHVSTARFLDSALKGLARNDNPPLFARIFCHTGCFGALAGLVAVLVLGSAPAWAAAPEKKPADKEPAALRPIRVATFDIDVRKGLEADGAALADRVNTLLATLPKVTIVNRADLKKVADEHKIALSGLVDNASAVQLGKFVSAQYVIVGGASKIGQTFYVVMKIIDVETTVQLVASAKASVEDGLDMAITRMGDDLAGKLRELQGPREASTAAREAW